MAKILQKNSTNQHVVATNQLMVIGISVLAISEGRQTRGIAKTVIHAHSVKVLGSRRPSGSRHECLTLEMTTLYLPLSHHFPFRFITGDIILSLFLYCVLQRI
ncbi:hypothetical protein CDAR_62761 [Caerostris darwini]|uniref:Uncharacterized protein n=1 Tax=Caerostris darwini TaxID=1538125 RepID=A0AAV4UF83_9ARAC|nr:hypothetical protein CDAR_62761 [Caerostris darwini]